MIRCTRNAHEIIELKPTETIVVNATIVERYSLGREGVDVKSADLCVVIKTSLNHHQHEYYEILFSHHLQRRPT